MERSRRAHFLFSAQTRNWQYICGLRLVPKALFRRTRRVLSLKPLFRRFLPQIDLSGAFSPALSASSHFLWPRTPLGFTPSGVTTELEAPKTMVFVLLVLYKTVS